MFLGRASVLIKTDIAVAHTFHGTFRTVALRVPSLYQKEKRKKKKKKKEKKSTTQKVVKRFSVAGLGIAV